MPPTEKHAAIERNICLALHLENIRIRQENTFTPDEEIIVQNKCTRREKHLPRTTKL